MPRPNYAVAGKEHAMPVEYYNGWTGGQIGITQPVRGDQLTSLETANELCKAALGEGFRMAEHHDGMYVIGMNEKNYYGKTWPAESQLLPGGWHWYAYGIIHSGTRFWVYINDQQQGNCWYNTTLKIARIDSVGSITAFSAEPFQGVRREAVKILRTKFSDADFEYDKDQPSMLVFRRTMREFIIYGLNKTGDWQKPMTVQGPDRGGLSVRLQR